MRYQNLETDRKWKY